MRIMSELLNLLDTQFPYWKKFPSICLIDFLPSISDTHIWSNQKWFYYLCIRNSIYTNIYHIYIYFICPSFYHFLMQFGILERSILFFLRAHRSRPYNNKTKIKNPFLNLELRHSFRNSIEISNFELLRKWILIIQFFSINLYIIHISS